MLFALASATTTILFAQSSIQTISQNFQNPPDAAKPMVRWWWFGLAVQKPEILRELEQMKADGIQGAELAFEYPQVLDDPSRDLKNLPFLSPEYLDDVHYAQAQGRRLGLRIDVTLGSGWPYGGPNTPLSQAAGRLRTAEVPIPSGNTSILVPQLAEGEAFIAADIADSKTVPPVERHRGHLAAPRPADFDPATAKPLAINGSTLIIASASQPRVALFFISSHTLQQVKRAAVGAEGYVLDPFSHRAVATHLQKVGEPLAEAFGSTPPYAIFSDSLEAYGADWTPDLLTEFQKRRGYNLVPHLPELVAGGTPEAERVRHDWGTTLTELVNENYLTQINNWAIAHHTKFRSQTYGEPAVSFSSQNLVSLAEGEGPQWRAFSTLRWATSANHVFGHDVTSGETFTWLHSPVFRATPLDMKAEADIDFIMGENQITCHGWPYSPPNQEVPEPGWSLYAAAALNDHNPWHPVMPDVTRYISRISYLLRQGKPANQVAILLPTDDAWASFSPSHVTVTGAMQRLIPASLVSAILDAGYNYDFIDADAIDKVGLGTHQILVLPPTDRIPVATLNKIDAWVKAGGKIISIDHTPTLDPEGKPLDASAAAFIPVVPDSTELAQALQHIGTPDLKVATSDEHTKEVIGFIRRRLPTSDIYFVVNTSNQPVEATATFASQYKNGVAIDPDSMIPTAASASGQVIHLAAYESRVFIFSGGPWTFRPKYQSTTASPSLPDLSSDWKVTFTATGKSETEQKLTDWTTNPATLHYSGEAVYSRDFSLGSISSSMPIFLEVDGGKALPGAPNSPPEHPALGPNGLPNPLITRPGPGMHAYYDPPIHEAAIVYINGKRAGSLWHPPYRLEISKFLKPGKNHIEIHVYNTALNAWSALPPHDYKPLIAKYGDRFQMQDLDKVKPIPSGILGSIRLTVH